MRRNRPAFKPSTRTVVQCSWCGKEWPALGGIAEGCSLYVVRRAGVVTVRHYACQFDCSRAVDARITLPQSWNGCPGFTQWCVETTEAEATVVASLAAALTR